MMNYNNNLRLMSEFAGNYDERIHIRELERRTSIDIKILYNSLKELVSNNILDYERKGNLKIYFLKKTLETLNFIVACEHYKTFNFLNQNKVLKPFLLELNKLCDFLIFGSFAKKRNEKESDVDVLVFSKNKKFIKELISKYGVNIHVQYSSYEYFLKSIKDKNHLANEIVKNHILFCDSYSFNKVIIFG